MAPYRVALIGAGISERHLVSYQRLPDKFSPVAICSLDSDRVARLATKFSIPLVAENLDAVLANDDIDIVDICTPPNLHFEMVRTALDAGKHVICEKPLFASLAEVDSMAEQLKQTDRRLMPIFQYRYGNGLQKLMHLCQLGVTGQPYVATLSTHWRRETDYYEVPWRGKWAEELGGCVLGHAIHAHDMLNCVFGEFESISAQVNTLVNEIEVEDCAGVTARMTNGAIATLSVTLGSCDEISHLRFCFENLTVENNSKPYVPSREPWTFLGRTDAIQNEIDAALETFKPLQQGYTGQFDAFFDTLESGNEPPVTLSDARRSLELVTAIYHSARTGTTQPLPINSDHPDYRSWLPPELR